jgi:hypothetical protein
MSRVDDELENFENKLYSALHYQMLVSFIWAETTPSLGAALDSLFTAVDLAHVPIRTRHQHVPVIVKILDDSRIKIKNCLWTAMNVPRPVDITNHCLKVVDNIMVIYYDTIYPILRTEMVTIHHKAAIIQRVWKRCITDPVHPACQRRLMREFERFEEDLAHLKKRVMSVAAPRWRRSSH